MAEMPQLTVDEQELFNVVNECNGAEIPPEWLKDAESLERKGLVTLGHSRCPAPGWRRAYPK